MEPRGDEYHFLWNTRSFSWGCWFTIYTIDYLYVLGRYDCSPNLGFVDSCFFLLAVLFSLYLLRLLY